LSDIFYVPKKALSICNAVWTERKREHGSFARRSINDAALALVTGSS
jgi:hypothetical protein